MACRQSRPCESSASRYKVAWLSLPVQGRWLADRSSRHTLPVTAKNDKVACTEPKDAALACTALAVQQLDVRVLLTRLRADAVMLCCQKTNGNMHMDGTLLGLVLPHTARPLQ